MSSTQWKEQLQQIIGIPVRIRRVDRNEWISKTQPSARSANVEIGDSAQNEENIWIAVRQDQDWIEILEMEDGKLTTNEYALIAWTVRNLKLPGKASGHVKINETERYMQELGNWLMKEMESGELANELPDYLTASGRLFNEMIPFLLVSEQAGRSYTYSELEKLLITFLEEDVMLIPLKEQEWLILGPVSLLNETANEERSEDEEDSEEDLLASMCSGMHGMLASEWIGECHLAVSQTITPAKSLVETLYLLRETIYLGRKFHVGSNIHLPWLLHLERLLNSIPEGQRSRYMEQMLKRSDVMLEPEILMTLETFFELDCNVSETAKKLYIHRNTLLYRLDKLKNETGLDVRLFSDAVLVKMILLLYKVTKRK